VDAGEPTDALNKDGDLHELKGSLPDLPDLAREDFERASELAQRDLDSDEDF
jgi:hypothetical protein